MSINEAIEQCKPLIASPHVDTSDECAADHALDEADNTADSIVTQISRGTIRSPVYIILHDELQEVGLYEAVMKKVKTRFRSHIRNVLLEKMRDAELNPDEYSGMQPHCYQDAFESILVSVTEQEYAAE